MKYTIRSPNKTNTASNTPAAHWPLASVVEARTITEAIMAHGIVSANYHGNNVFSDPSDNRLYYVEESWT